MSLYNVEDFTMPAGVVTVTTPEAVSFLEANSIDPTDVLAYRTLIIGTDDYVQWWIEWTHPVTGRVYVEDRRKAVEA
jgi:hypothetical protein